MIRAIFSVLVPFIIGFAFVRLLWRGAAATRAELGMQIALATGAGFGIFSSLFFLWLLLFNTRRGFQTTAILIAIGLIAFWLFRLRARLRLAPQIGAGGTDRPTKIDRIFSAGFFLALLSAIGTFIFAALKRPHGEWDAWASWNMRARFIYRGDNHWSTVFSKTLWYSGADYPLLLPASVAGCWAVAGSDTQAVPALIALLFTFATVGVVASAIAAIKGRKQGYLAGLAIIIAPSFILHGSTQYADIPLSFFFVATFALLHLYDSREYGDRLLLLAGVMAGLAAWTKNEGLLFIIAIAVSRVAVAISARRLKTCARQLLVMAKGFIPFLLMIIFLKLALAEPNPLLASQEGQTTFEKLTDASRYETIYRSLADNLLDFGGADRLASVWIILAVYLVAAGVRIERGERIVFAASVLALTIVLAGYFVVYLTTPFELGWHLSTTLARLLLQLWPCFIFLFFVIARPLDQLAPKKEDTGVNPEPVQQ